MSKMTKVGDRVKCPQCNREARVVWVSQEEKTVAVQCNGYHSHHEHKANPKKKPVSGMVFLIKASKKE